MVYELWPQIKICCLTIRHFFVLASLDVFLISCCETLPFSSVGYASAIRRQLPNFAVFMENTEYKMKQWQVLFMALSTGLIVANIYYCQPLVVMIAKEFHVPETKAGTITLFTQLGYALG